MKKLIAFILAITLVMSLVACGNAASAKAAEKNVAAPRFQIVSEDVSGMWVCTGVIVDTHTGVMYLYRNGSKGAFGICPLLNTDGTPIIWEGYGK